MAIKTEGQATSTSAALIHTSVNGHSDAPTGVIVYNNDATITVYVGGPDVTTSNGVPVLALTSFSVDLISGDQLWGVAASGTPNIRVLYTRV